MKLAIRDIRLEEDLQSRVELNPDAIAQYAENVDDLPPVTVYADGSAYWLVDGFHRVHAHVKAGRREVAVDVRDGAFDDALLFSLRANHEHDKVGQRRSNEDKRKSATTAIKKWPEWSDGKIADTCCLAQQTVRNVRGELTKKVSSADPAEAERLNPELRVGKDGKKRKAKKPPAKAVKKKVVAEQEPEPAESKRQRAADLPDEPAPENASPADPLTSEDLVAKVTATVFNAAKAWPEDEVKDALYEALTHCAKAVEPEDEEPERFNESAEILRLSDAIDDLAKRWPSGRSKGRIIALLERAGEELKEEESGL